MNKTGKRSSKKSSFFSPKKGNFKGKKKTLHKDSFQSTAPAHLQRELNQASQKTFDWVAGQITSDTAPKASSTQDISLDPWQQEAVNALVEGANVVVDAPTTAGKTRVVENYFFMHLKQATFRACYTCPVKSLSNDKLLEFRQMFGAENVGIATGDIKENLSAPIVVATLETYRNSLLGVEPDLGRSLVVFDEYHFLDDKERGSAWEEAMILTPPQCQMLLLSASISNGDEVASWIESLGKRTTRFVQTTFRPVPLEHLVWAEEKWISPKFIKQMPRSQPTMETGPRKFDTFARQLHGLDQLKLTPTIAYVARRADCEILAGAIAKCWGKLSEEESEKIEQAYDQVAATFHANEFLPLRLKSWILYFGVAYHHSGLAPKARLLVEYLLKQGTLKCCTATMGLSLGINFSVRSTFIADRKRPGAAGFQKYSSSEILQMTGRAGRRGRDLVGFSCWPDSKAHHIFSNAARKPCAPRLHCDHTTFLGLISRGYNKGQIENFYRKSFFGFHQNPERFKLPSKKHWTRLLQAAVPCTDPGEEYANFKSEKNCKCYDCPVKKLCHREFKMKSNPLTQLYIYLHSIGALSEGHGLTTFGEAARYFPQFGGLLVANMIVRGEVTERNFSNIVHFFGALSLSRLKSPGLQKIGRLPTRQENLIEDLKSYYPYTLFPEIYENESNYDEHAIPTKFRELNFYGSGLIELWTKNDGEITWKEFLAASASRNFGAGDATGLIYRTASMLQSIIQLGHPNLREASLYYRRLLLRSPLDLGLPSSEVPS